MEPSTVVADPPSPSLLFVDPPAAASVVLHGLEECQGHGTVAGS